MARHDPACGDGGCLLIAEQAINEMDPAELMILVGKLGWLVGEPNRSLSW